MGHYGVVVRDGEERRLRVHNSVPREFSFALSCEDVVYALPIACTVEGMRDAVFGGTEKRVYQGWKRKLTGAQLCHFACPGRRHRHALLQYTW